MSSSAQLCLVCLDAFHRMLVQHKSHPRYHPTLSSLLSSVSEGCRFCLQVKSKLNEAGKDQPEHLAMNMSQPLRVSGQFAYQFNIYYNSVNETELNVNESLTMYFELVPFKGEGTYNLRYLVDQRDSSRRLCPVGAHRRDWDLH